MFYIYVRNAKCLLGNVIKKRMTFDFFGIFIVIWSHYCHIISLCVNLFYHEAYFHCMTSKTILVGMSPGMFPNSRMASGTRHCQHAALGHLQHWYSDGIYNKHSHYVKGITTLLHPSFSQSQSWHIPSELYSFGIYVQWRDLLFCNGIPSAFGIQEGIPPVFMIHEGIPSACTFPIVSIPKYIISFFFRTFSPRKDLKQIWKEPKVWRNWTVKDLGQTSQKMTRE